MASKCEKITQKWPKRAKGCALLKPRQYFNGRLRKKTHFFTKKIFVDRESNPRPLRDKHLPNQLCHRGVVIELNLKLGATHISLARFLFKNKQISVQSCDMAQITCYSLKL